MSPQQVFEAMLDACGPGSEVSVLLDARISGVVVPENFRNGSLWLVYSRHYSPPIPDLRSDELGIWASLSFGGRLFKTFIPWGAIAVMQVPEEIGRGAFGLSGTKPARPRAVGNDEIPDEEEAAPSMVGRPALRVVRGDRG